jgi:hypothetical protein
MQQPNAHRFVVSVFDRDQPLGRQLLEDALRQFLGDEEGFEPLHHEDFPEIEMQVHESQLPYLTRNGCVDIREDGLYALCPCLQEQFQGAKNIQLAHAVPLN